MISALSPDDQPPASISDLDLALQRQLNRSVCKHFFEACDGVTQSILMECGWTVRSAEGLTLVIHCSDAAINRRLLNRIAKVAGALAQFSRSAKIRVHPPAGEGSPFDMQVDERSEYRGLP